MYYFLLLTYLGKFGDTLSFQVTPSCSLYTSPKYASGGVLKDPTIRYIIIGSGCGAGVLICIISIFSCGIFSLSIKVKRVAYNNARLMEMQYPGGEGEYVLASKT